MANNYSPLQPRNTRIITRPNGAAEFLITDHLGSTRLSIKANHLPTELTPTVYQDTKYYAFGDVRESDGQGARTGYIGREVDSESDLGAYGVRNYESATGRFLSTDPLWELYQGWNPYQYSLNNPVTLLDAGGKEVVAVGLEAQEAVRNSVPESFRGAISFDEYGLLDAERVQAAASGQDECSNISLLSEVAKSEERAIVQLTNTFVATIDASTGYKNEVSFEELDVLANKKNKTTGAYHYGVTLLPTNDQENLGIPGISSPNKYTSVIIRKDNKDATYGSTAAHELLVHFRRFLLAKQGQKVNHIHGKPGNPNDVDEESRRVEEEAKKVRIMHNKNRSCYLISALAIVLLNCSVAYSYNSTIDSNDSIPRYRKVKEVTVQQHTWATLDNGILTIKCGLTNPSEQDLVISPSYLLYADLDFLTLGMDQEMSVNVQLTTNSQGLDPQNCLYGRITTADTIDRDTASSLHFVMLSSHSAIEIEYRIALEDILNVKKECRIVFECFTNNNGCYLSSNVSFPGWYASNPVFVGRELAISKQKVYVFEGSIANSLMRLANSTSTDSSLLLGIQQYRLLQESMLRLENDKKPQLIEVKK